MYITVVMLSYSSASMDRMKQLISAVIVISAKRLTHVTMLFFIFRTKSIFFSLRNGGCNFAIVRFNFIGSGKPMLDSECHRGTRELSTYRMICYICIYRSRENIFTYKSIPNKLKLLIFF